MSTSLPSPAYASLRAVVRPAIVAHEVLRRQQEQIEPLVDEANELLALTAELLQKIGLAQAYDGGLSRAGTVTEREAQAAHMAAAYANVGMAWAELVAAVTSLAADLLAQGDVSHARRLAGDLNELGERSLAADLLQRIQEAADKQANETEVANRAAQDADESAARNNFREAMASIGESTRLKKSIIREAVGKLKNTAHYLPSEMPNIARAIHCMLKSVESMMDKKAEEDYGDYDEIEHYEEVQSLISGAASRMRASGAPDAEWVEMCLNRLRVFAK